MKVTVRQLRGRPGVNNWHGLLSQLQQTAISKFLVDVSTDRLDDFFQHVRQLNRRIERDNLDFYFIQGQNCWISWSLL